MEKLHLIVHKSMIEEELKSELTEDKKKPRLAGVLKRIREIETTEKHVKPVRYDAKNEQINQDIHNVADICAGYSSVILYGISTEVCLPYVEQKLKENGFEVSYDQQGTID